MKVDRRLLETGGRSNNFDALRVLLAVTVIFSHSYPLLLGSNDFEPVFRATGGQRTAGELAVDGFFLLSGFLIAASWQRSRGLLDYLRRRVLRIFPGFLVAVLFSGLVAGPLVALDSRVYWKEFQPSRFVIQAFNLAGAHTPPPNINGSLWSVRYEFFCYLAIAGMGLIGMLRWRLLVALAAIECAVIHASLLHFHYEYPGSGLSWLWCYPGFWPRLAACFLMGACFHLYGDRIIRSGWLVLACAVGLVLAGILPTAQALPVLTPFLGGYLLFSLAFFPAGRLRDFARRGDLSYGLYLYAFPVQLLLVRWFKPYLNPITLTGVAVVVTTVLAAMSWFLVERPFLRLKRTGAPIVETARREPPVPERRPENLEGPSPIRSAPGQV